MRYFLTIVFVMIFFVLSVAQDTTFNKKLTFIGGSSTVMSIDTFNNNYYILVTSRDTPDVNRTVYGILKLNPDFSVQDSGIFNYPNSGMVINFGKGFIISKYDSSLIFAGALHFSNNLVQNGYIAKIDKNLDTLWTKQIKHPDTAYADTAATPWVSLMDAVIDDEGSYLIAGTYNYHCQGNYNRSFILKMNSTGNIIWEKFIDPSVTTRIANIEYDYQDSGFYYASPTKLRKFDKDCNLIWETIFNNQIHPTIIGNINLINQNEMIVAMAYINEPIVPQSFTLLSVSKVNTQSHTLVWERTFPSISVYSQYMEGETVTITKTPDNNIAIGTVGKRIDGAGEFYSDERAYLLLLNQNGDSLWSHYYTYQNDSFDVEDMQFADMVVCPDGGFLFGGSYYSFPNDPVYMKAWLVKTDSLGNAPGMFTVGIEEEELVIRNLELKIFPNPASDNITLSMQENPKDDLQLEIYNISGKLVMQQQLPAFEKEHRVDVQNLQTGVYLVKLTMENQLVFSGKIIKD